MQKKTDFALTSRDHALLRLLQHDCRIPHAELAERVGMSVSACWRRVRALEQAGLIKRYTCMLDARAAGLGFSALVHVSLSRHDRSHVETFVARILDRPEVLDCYATTGDADYHLRVVCADADAYNRFLDDFLFDLPGISRIRTNLVLKEIKQTSELPL